MNRPEVNSFLKSFFAELKNTSFPIEGPYIKPVLEPLLNIILSLKQNLPLSIPLLRELALITTKVDFPYKSGGLLYGRINRLYTRLCRVTNELGRLDFKKAAMGSHAGLTLEDFVFSQIDFSRYREIGEKDFYEFFLEGLNDFNENFFINNFGLEKKEIKQTIEDGYKKTNGFFRIQREGPLILSIMRTLETSLENPALLTPMEIQAEMDVLLNFIGAGKQIKDEGLLYKLLVLSLDNVTIAHDDGIVTKLFISPEGDLLGIFLPGNKAWTRILIPKELVRIH